MSEESVIYASIISGFGAIIIVIIKHWRASKCWTKNECCSCNLYREPASPDSNPLDTTNVTFKVDLDVNDDNIVEETIILHTSPKQTRRIYLSSIDEEEHIPITEPTIEIKETTHLENISQV